MVERLLMLKGFAIEVSSGLLVDPMSSHQASDIISGKHVKIGCQAWLSNRARKKVIEQLDYKSPQ